MNEQKTSTVKIGDSIAYLDENDKLRDSVVTSSNLNWVTKNLGERVFPVSLPAEKAS